MIHGDCSSRGCYAMTDEQIAEIYALARESFFGGQKAFQIQAYPFRMTPANMAKHRNSPHMAFWKHAQAGLRPFRGHPARAQGRRLRAPLRVRCRDEQQVQRLRPLPGLPGTRPDRHPGAREATPRRHPDGRTHQPWHTGRGEPQRRRRRHEPRLPRRAQEEERLHRLQTGALRLSTRRRRFPARSRLTSIRPAKLPKPRRQAACGALHRPTLPPTSRLRPPRRPSRRAGSSATCSHSERANRSSHRPPRRPLRRKPRRLPSRRRPRSRRPNRRLESTQTKSASAGAIRPQQAAEPEAAAATTSAAATPKPANNALLSGAAPTLSSGGFENRFGSWR